MDRLCKTGLTLKVVGRRDSIIFLPEAYLATTLSFHGAHFGASRKARWHCRATSACSRREAPQRSWAA